MKIDLLKSIENGHVTAIKKNWTDNLEAVGLYLETSVWLVLFFGPTFMVVRGYLTSHLSTIGTMISIVSSLLGVYLIFCLFYYRRLTKIRGTSIDVNKEIIISLLNGYYPGLRYSWHNNILIASKAERRDWKLINGLKIVVLFKEAEIYLNILSVYRGPNIWMTFTNIGRAKEIGNMVLERLRYQTPHNNVLVPGGGSVSS